MRAVVIGLAVALTACASLGGRLLTASDDLEERADQFYDEVRHDQQDSAPSVEEADNLARAAADFRRAVEQGRPREELDAAFEEIARPYHILRGYYDARAADPVTRGLFQDVTEAYLDVEGALRYRLSEFSSENKVR